MAKRKTRPRFESLWEAVGQESVDDVRRMLGGGADPDEREDRTDPTPLMYAAALGRLDVVEALVEAGAEVDTATEYFAIDLPAERAPDDQPSDVFLKALTSPNATDWMGWTAPVYAAVYGRRAVLDYLAPRASAAVRRQAEAVAGAREDYFRAHGADTAIARKRRRSESGAAAARKTLLAEHPKLSRWIVRCALCGRQGYKPTMPDEIDRQGMAARVRKLFRPLVLEDMLCPRCRDKVERGRKAAEALVEKRMKELPPHVKIKVIQRSRRKKRPGGRTKH